jgi:hypothetical protein
MSAHASASIASAALAFVLLSAPFEEHLRKKMQVWRGSKTRIARRGIVYDLDV